MSTITLKGMKFHALHGVLPVEGIIGNNYVVNITLEADTSKAEETDNLEGTINYADVYDLVAKEMEQPSKLIEHVASRIKRAIISHNDGISHLEVEVQKQRPPVRGEVAYASITLTYDKK